MFIRRRNQEMDNEFGVAVMFPDEYKDFVAEICYGAAFVCTIIQDRGAGNFDIDFERTKAPVPLPRFLETVNRACRRLDDLRERRTEE